jgi:uncharacterized membrane protein YfcA
MTALGVVLIVICLGSIVGAYFAARKRRWLLMAVAIFVIIVAGFTLLGGLGGYGTGGPATPTSGPHKPAAGQ